MTEKNIYKMKSQKVKAMFIFFCESLGFVCMRTEEEV